MLLRLCNVYHILLKSRHFYGQIFLGKIKLIVDSFGEVE